MSFVKGESETANLDQLRPKAYPAATERDIPATVTMGSKAAADMVDVGRVFKE